ncbi:MAG: hypothetical protein IJN63_07645 [Clostridia bacterium]|nr:hypothetical protein [Clostridia bacterium]
MLSMKWYKFLISFGLFAGAFLNLIYGLNYVTGGIYLVQTNGQLSADDIYRHYGESLRYTDIAFGIFLIVFAIFGIVLRNKLAKFKSEAPKLVNVFYASSAVGILLYSIVFSTITSTGFDALQIVSAAVSVIIWFANFKYFRNREHLFVGRQAIQQMPNVQNSYSLSYSDEKPKTYGNNNVYGSDISYTPSDEAPAATAAPAANVDFAKNEAIDSKINVSFTIQPPKYEMDAEYGLVLNKPICTQGTNEMWHYLNSLRTINGDVINWICRGSFSVEGISGPIMVYDAYLPSGAEYKTVYISPLGNSTPSFAPKGFSYLSTSTRQQIQMTSSSKTKKLTKGLIIIGTIVIVLAIGVLVGIPEYNYRQACSLLNERSYVVAIEMFENLDGYKDSENKINEAKYGYVLRYNNNDDITTFEYLKQLCKLDYKDSLNIYDRLYEWRIIVTAINSSEENDTNHRDAISRFSPVIFHLKLMGGEPNSSVRITVKSYYPNGATDEYVFDDKWSDGETGWYGWYDGFYEYPENGETGMLQCKFYDEEGNLIGSGSVRITD